MALLSRDDILQSVDTETKTIEVPEWGGEVIVSTMSGFARDRFETSLVGKSGGTNLVNIRAKLAAATLVDDKGKLVFSQDDIEKLGKKSCAALDRVFAASQQLNRLFDKDIEDLAGN